MYPTEKLTGRKPKYSEALLKEKLSSLPPKMRKTMHDSANALKISNLFYESGICEWSEIDYGSLSIPYSLYRK